MLLTDKKAISQIWEFSKVESTGGHVPPRVRELGAWLVDIGIFSTMVEFSATFAHAIVGYAMAKRVFVLSESETKTESF